METPVKYPKYSIRGKEYVIAMTLDSIIQMADQKVDPQEKPTNTAEMAKQVSVMIAACAHTIDSEGFLEPAGLKFDYVARAIDFRDLQKVWDVIKEALEKAPLAEISPSQPAATTAVN